MGLTAVALVNTAARAAAVASAAAARWDGDALFRSARQAMAFATSRAGAPLRPLMNRMVRSGLGEDEDDAAARARASGLAGLDAAAQAGLVLGTVGALGEFARAILVAGAAPKTLPCSCGHRCCSRRYVNTDWGDAVWTITSVAERLGVFRLANPGGGPDRMGRDARASIVVKIYSRTPMTFAHMSRGAGVSADALARHHREVLRWLMGNPRWSVGGARDEGADPQAWAMADALLRGAGLVGGD